MIFTIPNVISFVRILAVPLFLWVLFGRDDPAVAGWLLGAIGATDWIDGYLARRLGQVSELGKFLDPLADRLAVAVAVVAGWISGDLPWWFSLALIVRESAIAVGALVLGLRARAKLEVRQVGKAATAALYVAIPNFFICGGTDHWLFCGLAWGFGMLGLVLYYMAAAHYVGDMRRILGGEDGAVSSADVRPGDDG